MRYEDQPAAGLFLTGGTVRDGRALGPSGVAFGAGVGDLDAHGTAVRCGMEAEVEVPAGDVSVLYGVGGELGEDQHDRVVRVGAVRDAPRVQTYGRETAGEAGSARCGGEAHLEGVVRGGAV